MRVAASAIICLKLTTNRQVGRKVSPSATFPQRNNKLLFTPHTQWGETTIIHPETMFHVISEKLNLFYNFK